MISKLGLYPGGSWIFHNACQICQVDKEIRNKATFGRVERERANVLERVKGLEDGKALPFMLI